MLPFGFLHQPPDVALVLVPTFVGLATGDGLESSVRVAVRWTSANAVGAVTLAMATLVAFFATGLLTIAFVLVFAGFAATFHVHVLLEPPEHEQAAEQDQMLYASADGTQDAN